MNMAEKAISKKCELCEEGDWRYRCPGCQVRTCSLQCVRQHKLNTGCTGQRDKTAYVRVKDFTDLGLLSDYRFLEDAARQNNNATRDDLKRKHYRPGFLKELEKQAGIRNIDLRLMPYPMSRRKNNYTTYQHKSKSILWQIEWRFPQVDLVLTDKRIPESSTLQSVLDRHLGNEADPLMRHKLRPYLQAGSDQWAVFVQVEDSPRDQCRYHRLDVCKTITENLAHKCVIEYPTLHVVLQSHWSQYNTEIPVNTLPEVEVEPDREADDKQVHTTETVTSGTLGESGTSDSESDSDDTSDDNDTQQSVSGLCDDQVTIATKNTDIQCT